MVITIDVGNTNITVGVFRGDEVMATFRITTKMPRVWNAAVKPVRAEQHQTR